MNFALIKLERMKKYLLLPLALIACGCVNKNDSTDYIRTVCVSNVSGTSEISQKKFAGIVKEGNSISIGFKTAGQISGIYVKEGDLVTTGQLLATLDDVDYKLGVEALQIQYNQINDEVNRARRLFEKKSMSANDYEKAEAGLKQVAVQLQINKIKLAYTRLYAPTSGVIETVNFAPSEMVDAGTSVFTLIDNSNMEIVCDIPARIYHERDRFTTFNCTPSSDPCDTCSLRLLNIVPKADNNQLYRMYLIFNGKPTYNITAGTNVDVTIGLAPKEKRTTVPAKAVFHNNGADWVWILNSDSTISARRVEIDKTLPGKLLTVLSGITEGETVVSAGVTSLHEGERVKVAAETSETNIGCEL